MKYEAKPNTATIFVENGIFNKQGVEQIMSTGRPILKASINVDGKDLEIAFRFKNTWDDIAKAYTKELYVTSTGNKMLIGKVELPFVPNAVASVQEDNSDPFDDQF